MHEEETIKQPQERIKQLELENELLKARLGEIEPLKAKICELVLSRKSLNLNRSLSLNTKLRITDVPAAGKKLLQAILAVRMKANSENNVIAHATMLKYDGRMPHRKIHDAMMRLFGLKISPATILDLTRRAADAVQSEYDAILKKIRGAPILYVDETSIHVQGERHWIWTFSTPSESFFVIRKSRGMKVLTEVLTRKFKGIIVCDGWKPYARFTNRIQRCWAHLLRESKEISEKFEEAIPLHNMLKELYEILTEALENDPPPKVRKNLWKLARKVLRQWIRKEYSVEKVRKFIGKINNGFDYWFTFIINPDVEPTNNRAERALRPHDWQRDDFQNGPQVDLFNHKASSTWRI